MKNKKKVRTCGNCIHLVKREKGCFYKHYTCLERSSDTIITSCYRKPSTPTDCHYHKFKNENHETEPINESTKQIIDSLYGKEIDNKLLTFLEEKK
jgi:hypothetical protein